MKSDMDTTFREEMYDALVAFFQLGLTAGIEGNEPRTIMAEEALCRFADVSPCAEEVFRSWCASANLIYMRGFRKGHAEWVSSKKRRPLHRRKIEDDGRNVEVNSGTQL